MYKLVVFLVILGVTHGAPQPKNLPKPEERIMGGENATISDHPYIVSVIKSTRVHCAGTLISLEWVVTAAQCISMGVIYSVRAGSTYRNSGGQVIDVATMLKHENFSATTLDYDIALLRLVRPVDHPDALPIYIGGGPTIRDHIFTVSGWGTLYEGGPATADIHTVSVRHVAWANCRLIYGEDVVTNTMFCTGSTEGGQGACQGDTGGPIVRPDSRLVGLVSWGTGCGNKEYPDVNTIIMKNWITLHTGI